MIEKNDAKQFAKELANKYTALFNVYRDETLVDIPLSFIAIYHRRDERYMVAKRFKVYGIENQQIVFTKTCESLSHEKLQQFQQAIETNILQYIPKKDDHMSTSVLGIIVTANKVDAHIIKEVKRYRKVKFITYGLHGWFEIYTVLINLLDHSVHVHPKGKPFIKSIQKLLKGETVTR